MKFFKSILVAQFIVFAVAGFSQSFTQNGNVNIPDNAGEVCSNVTVAAIGTIDGTLGLETVCIKINHTWDSDLDIFLVAPDGTRIELSTDNGGGGDNYGNGGGGNGGPLTCFDMAAGTAITAGAAPFTGSFVPEENLGLVNNGQNANGVWSLCVTDDAGGDTGFINTFTITFSATPAPPPIAPVNDLCANATALPCGTTNLAGTTINASNIVNGAGCTQSDYGVWYSFVGDGQITTISSTASGGFDQEMAIASGACGALVNVTCEDAGFGNGTESYNFTSTLGVTYFVYISHYGSGNSTTGDFTISRTCAAPPSGGDDCASPTRIACGDPVTVGETTIGLTDVENDWACGGLPGPNPYLGLDHFYVVEWPDAANGGTIRLQFTNVSDADASYLELLSLGSSCAPDACSNSNQLDIATGNFGTGNNFIEFTVGAGVVDYYFVVDSQGDGVDDAIDSYDIQAICFATGIELDVNSACTPIPITEAANQGYYVTWNGAAPPLTGDAVTLAAGGPYTVCENIYIENPAGWEWLKDFEVTLGECWTNVASLTPDGTNNGFFDVLGDWSATIGGGSPTILSWEFAGGPNPAWGDGSGPSYNCNLYTFCYTADVDPLCNSATGLQNGISATDDGIGGGGGGAVNANNITVGATGPTVLPVDLLSFSATPIEKNGDYAVMLRWKTSTEINNDFFTIERSTDGTYFEAVFTMPGSGNSTDINNYMGIDEDPFDGLSYYRLKQTDFDGKFEYFDMVSVNISNISDLKVYPNPVESNLTISMDSKLENSMIVVSLYNTQGKLVLRNKNVLDKGKNSIQINTENYSQGLYFISIEHNGKKENLKFSKK